MLKENTEKATGFQGAGLFKNNSFPGILKFLSLFKHLWMAACQNAKEKRSE